MALTATAQSALPLVPSWGDAIVPTLRKRLEHESRALAKRISAASIGSIQDNSPEYSSHSHNHYHPHRDDAPGPSFSPRPSGIPRPSLQSSHPSISGDRPTTPTSTSSPFKRTRTLSQPKLMEPNSPAASRPEAPDPRAVSPHTPRPSDVRPTRIPVPRTRTPSTSGHAQSSMGRSESRNGASSSSHTLSFEAPRGAVAEHPQRHRSRTRGPSIDSMVPRPSVDSEERPFEHWYRGEVSRNGGVGELRVGRRMEMLDIANYGHVQMRPVDHWRNGGAGNKRHRRAGSTDAHLRGSIYMEADGEHARVLDEAPPTDVEDFESDLEHRSTGSVTRAGSPATSSTTMRQYPGLGVADGLTPVGGVGSSHAGPRSRSGSRTALAQPSRIPTPSMSRQLSDPPRTPTPTQMGASVPAEPDSPRAATRKVRQDNTPPSPPRVPTVTPQTPKKRAKSPATIAQSPSTKKSRSRAPPVSQPRPNRDLSKRRSVGEYPVPTDENIADAIPTWTQPVSPGGNWDDVVVPVVARKKGLGEFYIKADGRQQKRPRSLIPEPAPGTFGYDYSKVRSRLGEDDDIPMADIVDNTEPEPSDERGAPPIEPQINGGGDGTKEGRVGETIEEHVRMRMQPSPAPFSRYQRSMGHENGEGQSLTTADIKPPVASVPGRIVQGEEEVGAGCCKCVIM